MNALDIFTKDLQTIDVDAIAKKAYPLSPQQQAFIDYKALGGIVLDKDTHTMEKWSMDVLAGKLGVTPQTLYNWRDAIPDFWGRVADRRQELNSGEWLARMHEKWKLKAMEFKNWPLTEAWLINFDPTYRAPKIKVEHEVGNTLTALLGRARESNRKDNAIEAEVVDEPSSDNA